jgi:glycosyltransferase involved in cell wall biosynthesis
MDLFAMPSRYENFSNAILEAMACSVPFLSSDTGGNRLLESTGAGWLFETNSDVSLADGLLKILEDRPELRARGEKARLAVQGRYSWKVSAECLERIIWSRFGIKP